MRLSAGNDPRSASGWRVVVCTRRGHGELALTTPVFNPMGCTDDLREQLERIRECVPDSPLVAIGVSAGSALLVRYLGEEGPRSLIRAATTRVRRSRPRGRRGNHDAESAGVHCAGETQ